MYKLNKNLNFKIKR